MAKHLYDEASNVVADHGEYRLVAPMALPFPSHLTPLRKPAAGWSRPLIRHAFRRDHLTPPRAKIRS